MSFSIKQLLFWDKYIIDFMFICSATSCYTVKDCVCGNNGKCMDPLSNELVYLPFCLIKEFSLTQYYIASMSGYKCSQIL